MVVCRENIPIVPYCKEKSNPDVDNSWQYNLDNFKKIKCDHDHSILTFIFFIAVGSSPPLPDNVFEGDIDLTQEQLMNIDIYGDVRGNNSRAAGSNSRIRWPNGIIPYEIDCSLRKYNVVFFLVNFGV